MTPIAMCTSELRPSKEELAAKANEEEDMQAVKPLKAICQATRYYIARTRQGLRPPHHNYLLCTLVLIHCVTIQ